MHIISLLSNILIPLYSSHMLAKDRSACVSLSLKIRQDNHNIYNWNFLKVKKLI